MGGAGKLSPTKLILFLFSMRLGAVGWRDGVEQWISSGEGGIKSAAFLHVLGGCRVLGNSLCSWNGILLRVSTSLLV